MRAAWYAKAFYELANSRVLGDAKLVEHFTQTVINNGHASMFPRIVRSLEHLRQHDEKKTTIEVTSAEVLSEHQVTSLLRQEPFKHLLSPKHRKVVRKVDESLVGGTVVRTGAVRVDASYKRALLGLYQSVTSSQ